MLAALALPVVLPTRAGAPVTLRDATPADRPACDAGLRAVLADPSNTLLVAEDPSDAARTDAHRFYERLGFVGSHVGFKRVVG